MENFKHTAMKKTALFILMTLSLAAFTISCQKDEDPIQSTNPGPQSLPGNWKVSLYVDNNKDETGNYSNYTFEFSQNGDFIAKTANNEFGGTWSEIMDDNKLKLVISIAGNDDLLELSDDWVIISMNETEIRLEDDNQTDPEQLNFVKVN